MALEARLLPAEWERAVELDGGAALRIMATMGVLELARVDVEERPDTVTITLYERYWHDTGIPDDEQATIALGLVTSFDVPISSPLAGRRLVDGATGTARRRIGPRSPAAEGDRVLVPVGREFEWEELAGRPWYDPHR
jgi:hypothetical protein